ncbi:Pentatricopeptide repeat-containing protein [Acorus calamus]|uniref:Pentatricopeptide repeat-containing protein n=1 Tax=Acorus calamus TaxID=4465 RepID=A0AAV9CY11_ACOCL|nr:Pentatricopeptide repeat-containing protein [Acorus calamus]
MVRSGLDLDTSIANSLITMYGKCGKTDDARLVFDGLLHRDVISWNSMLAGYEQNKQIDFCFNLPREMQLSGFKPDNHSLTIIASAASSSNPAKPTYKRLCREIHCYALRRGATESCYTGNAIIAMYANNNRLQDAEKIFKRMCIKDSYTWNAMMDGYSTNGFFNESMTLFIDMHKQGLQSDHLAFSSQSVRDWRPSK